MSKNDPLSGTDARLLQILQQDAPGHTVHNEMMDGEEQAAAAIGNINGHLETWLSGG